MAQTNLKIKVDLDEMIDVDLDSPVNIPTPPKKTLVPSQGESSLWKQVKDLFSSTFCSNQRQPDQPACTRS